MPMRAGRNIKALRAVLGLILFACCLGGSIFHVHLGNANPDCSVCQALHANQADVSVRTEAPDAPTSFARLSTVLSRFAPSPLLLVPQGRAPPLA